MIPNNFIPAEGSWRVSCLGHARYKHKPRSLPVVAVALHPSRANKLPATSEIIQELPVSLLPLIKMGEYWERGKKPYIPNRKSYTFRAHGESVRCAEDIQFSSLLTSTPGNEGSQHQIAADQHHYYSTFRNAYCLKIITTQKISLLIPCWEIIRFYFGSSSQLLSALFKEASLPNALYDEQKSPPIQGEHAHIHLRKDLPDISAADIARIRFSNTARKSAELVRVGLQSQIMAGKPAFPRTIFPVEEIVNLQVQGQWLNWDTEDRAFLCFEILTCNARFPFKTLSFFRDLPGDTNPDPDKEKLTPIAIHKHVANAQPWDDGDILAEDANSIIQPIVFKMEEDKRFPHLPPASVEKKREAPYTHRSDSKHSTIDGEIEKGVGKGSYEDIVGVNLQKDEPDDTIVTDAVLPDNLSQFFLTLELLEKQSQIFSVDFVTLNTDKNDSRCTVLPLGRTPMGKVSKRSFVDYHRKYNTSPKIRRRAVIARIHTKFKTVYLIEIEVRIFSGKQEDNFSYLQLINTNGSAVHPHELSRILQNFCDNGCQWDIPEDFHHLKARALKHPSKKAGSQKEHDSYVETFARKLLSEICPNRASP